MNDATRASGDSGGVPWSGRELTGSGFAGDLGVADPSLLAALDDPQDEVALMRAVAQARLLIPIVAVPGETGDPGAPDGSAESDGSGGSDGSGESDGSSELDGSGELGGSDGSGGSDDSRGRPAGKSTDMAVVTLTSPDGQRAFPVFSSLATLMAWDATARPSPVTSARAAQGAVSERCDVLLLDCGSARERVLRPSMLWALAQQRDWLPAHTDPFVAEALAGATDDEDDVIGCAGEGDPAAPGILRVVLSLRAGLDAAQMQALATRIGERIATDGEARARIDGLSFTIRQA